MGQTCLKAQVRGAQKLHSPLWARKMGGLSKWNQKKLDWQLWAKLFEGPSKRDPKTSIPTLGRKNGRPQVNGTKKT